MCNGKKVEIHGQFAAAYCNSLIKLAHIYDTDYCEMDFHRPKYAGTGKYTVHLQIVEKLKQHRTLFRAVWRY